MHAAESLRLCQARRDTPCECGDILCRCRSPLSGCEMGPFIAAWFSAFFPSGGLPVFWKDHSVCGPKIPSISYPLALAAGCTVVLKPAEATPLVSQHRWPHPFQFEHRRFIRFLAIRIPDPTALFPLPGNIRHSMAALFSYVGWLTLLENRSYGSKTD